MNTGFATEKKRTWEYLRKILKKYEHYKGLPLIDFIDKAF